MGRRGRIGGALFLGANLLGALALFWASTERLPVRVIVTANAVTGSVGGAVVATTAPANLNGARAGLFLQGADPQTTVDWAPASSGGANLTDWLYRLGAESAWTDVRITNLQTGQRLDLSTAPRAGGQSVFGDWFHHPFGGESTASPGLLLLNPPRWTDYEIDATVLRPRNAAGLLVDSPDGRSGLLFYFRPEDRDVMWFAVRDGQLGSPIASAPYRAFAKDAASTVADVLREALGGYPAAVLIAAIAALLGQAEAGRRRRVPVPIAGGAGAPATAPDRSADEPTAAPRGTGRWIASHLPDLAAGTLALAELAVGLYVADVLLQRMPHVQDSVAYLFQAKTFALGRLWVPMPPEPASFMHEFIVMKDGRWFSKYPPGWPALLALGVLVGQPWIVSPICGALSLWLLYRLGREIYRPSVGLLAAALGLTSPFVIFLSGSLMAHASGLLFALLLAWTFWRTTRSPRPLGMAIACGVAFGVLFLIRPWTGLMVAVPFALYAVVAIVRRPLDGLPRYLPAALASLPFGVAFLVYNKIFTGNPFYPPQQLWWPFDQVGFGPGHGPYGFTPLDGLHNTSLNFAELLRHGFGWPTVLTLSLALVPFVARRARVWDWLWLGGFLALAAGYAAWWADGIMFGPRFYYEGFGFLILLTARGVDVALDLAAGPVVPHPWPLSSRGEGGRPRWTESQQPGRRTDVRGSPAEEVFSAPAPGNSVPDSPPGPRSSAPPLSTAGEGPGVRPSLPVPGGGGREGVVVPSTGRAEMGASPTGSTSSLVARGFAAIGPTLVYAFVAGLILFNLTFYLPGQWQLYHGYNYVNRSKLDAVAAAGIHHAVVFADVGPWYAWWEYGMVFSANDPLLQGDVIYARDLGDAADRAVMQSFPGRRYYRLNGTTITPLTP